MSESLPAFGDLLRQARELNGLSCCELAHAAGLDPSAVSRLENHERMPKRQTVERLALLLEAPLAADFRDQMFAAAGYLPLPSDRLSLEKS